MLRYIIFAINTVMLAFSAPTLADAPPEPIFIDIVLNDVNKSPIDVEFGPCRWTMDGEIITNSSIGKSETSIIATHAERDNGYRMSLVCQEFRQKDLNVLFGIAKNVNETTLFDPLQSIFIEPIDEHTIYLKFTKKWGRR